MKNTKKGMMCLALIRSAYDAGLNYEKIVDLERNLIDYLSKLEQIAFLSDIVQSWDQSVDDTKYIEAHVWASDELFKIRKSMPFLQKLLDKSYKKLNDELMWESFVHVDFSLSN